MTPRAGRHLAFGNTRQIYLATQRDFLGICRTASARLLVIEGGNVCKVLICHVVNLTGH
jgi:hypothetical protein